MKTLKLIFALMIIGTFTFSCTPTSLTEDTSDATEIVATDDDETNVDDDKDGQ